MKRRAVARVATSLGAAGMAMTAAGMLAGLRGFAVCAALSLLWIAWRHDNEVGVCLPLAVLVLIVAGVLCLLIYLLMIAHPH